jgi:hypothetical protein
VLGHQSSKSFTVTVMLDSDADGSGDELDADDDNDGVPDASDQFPTDGGEAHDGDGDGVGDNADGDDDNDGVPDAVDLCPSTAGTAPSGCAVSIAPPTALSGSVSSFKAGRAVPLKWQYTTNGVVVDSANAAPVVEMFGPVTCGATTGGAPVAVSDAGKSGLRYDAATRTWHVNWKPAAPPGCYYLTIRNSATGQVDGPYRFQLTR